MDCIKDAKAIHEDVIGWRRELHKIPELGFELKKTVEFIKDRLGEMDIEYKTIAKTGLVAIVRGEKCGPTVAFRADMDALPIKELTHLPFSSENSFMHACGHDAHMAMLLGAAKILSINKQKIKGSVKLLFQPAEENEGGARKMIDEGCMEDPTVDMIFGLHIGALFEEVKNGQIGIHYQASMASVDKFAITIKGKGGHGAAPHTCVDPITTACEIVTCLQKIVSREINPIHPAVLSIGIIKGGTAFNIIPELVTLEGTVRTTNLSDRTYIEYRIKEMSKNIAAANRAEVEVNYINHYPATINDIEVARKLIMSAEKIVGKDKIVELKNPTMVSEDMSYYLQNVPGAYFFLGSQNPDKGITYPHHHSRFDIDEDVLWIGPAVFVQVVMDILNNENKK